MRRALLLLPALLLIGLTAGMGTAMADDCETGNDQCPQEYGGGCVPAGSVCCPDGTYGEPGQRLLRQRQELLGRLHVRRPR